MSARSKSNAMFFRFLRKEFITFFIIIWFGLVLNDILSMDFPGRYTYYALNLTLLTIIASIFIKPAQRFIFKKGTPIGQLKPYLNFLLLMVLLSCVLLWQIVSFKSPGDIIYIPGSPEYDQPNTTPKFLQEDDQENSEYLDI